MLKAGRVLSRDAGHTAGGSVFLVGVVDCLIVVLAGAHRCRSDRPGYPLLPVEWLGRTRRLVAAFFVFGFHETNPVKNCPEL